MYRSKMLAPLAQMVVVGVMGAALASCASRSKDIEPAYVSTVGYSHLNCGQLGIEAKKISNRAAVLTGKQDKKADKDAVAVGVSLVLFWPAVFFVEGDKTTAAEISRLKGEMNAIEQVSKAKHCQFQFQKS